MLYEHISIQQVNPPRRNILSLKIIIIKLFTFINFTISYWLACVLYKVMKYAACQKYLTHLLGRIMIAPL
jgi:hypothetical protein